MGCDHSRPDLIWNHHTREELRAALQSEIAAFNHQQSTYGTGTGTSKGGDHILSWNYKEFEINYESLSSELKIGDYYIRVLLNPPPGVKAPALPSPIIFFDLLYHRFLLETEVGLQDLCLQAMTVVYKHYGAKVGPFLDLPQLARILKSTNQVVIRDRLLLLLDRLLMVPENIKTFVDCKGIELFVELLTLVHLNENKEGIPMASNLILGPAGQNSYATEEWFYSVQVESEDKSKKKFQRSGPVTVEELTRLYDDGTVTPQTKVWAPGMDKWLPLDDIAQLRWRLCSEGESVLGYVKIGLLILEIFNRLVGAAPSRDANGAIIFPIPRSKSILSSPACLAHVIQVILTFEPSLVDKTAQLLQKLVIDNLTVLPKLYQYGLFYFCLLYPGSNILAISQLLSITHNLQHFREGHVLRGSDYSSKSVLSLMLPASMISILDLYGPDKFSEIYLGEFDNPEAIWNVSMRRHMMEKLSMHVGDFIVRLPSHTMTLYPYAPIAPIVYPQLSTELFCHVFYLRHLCDVKRFPKWKIREPVVLLQTVLAAWLAELNKKGSDISRDEALKTLGLEPRGAYDENDFRKAYYKLAAKYHPDKNPDGRGTSCALCCITSRYVRAHPDCLCICVRC